MKKKKKDVTREMMFMKDKQGVKMNEALKGKNPQKYGALGQH